MEPPPDDPGLDGGEDYDQNDEEFGDEEVAMLDAEHPIMERVQAALTKQLQGAHENISLRLREKEEELRLARRKREDVGVDLYQVQQQLARLQMNLEKTHENHSIISQMREAAEDDLVRIKNQHAVQLQNVQEHRKKYDKYQAELDQLNMTLRQVEAYNEQMKSEISVTRRATYKAEESITNLEKDKKSQDLLIDSLNEQLKRLHEQLALYEAQLISQKQETQAASQTLSEANSEMEAINFEKKQLLQQWKSALIGMQRRDEALQATEEALRKQREQEMAIDGEIAGFKKSIKAEEERNEQLTQQMSKLESESKFVETSIGQVVEKHEKLTEKYSMCKKSLDQTDSELTKVQQQRHQLEEEINLADAKTQKLVQETQKLEDALLHNLSEQMAVEKSAQNTANTAEKLRTVVHEKEMQAASLQNELARIRVDSLNTMSHNAQLKQQLENLMNELKQKDALILKYEQEIRRRNDEIEKKQYEVDRLNRKFDSLVRNMEDENTGPLEATINNLTKEINQKSDECSDLQRTWIRHQTDLVALQNDNNTQAEKIQDLKAKLSILDQKRIRIDQSFDQQHTEVKDLERGIANMHNDMAKLNGLISDYSQKQEKLADENFNLETEFVKKLKELELDAVGLENSIVALKEEKERLLLDIVEAEQQLMLWEKKIGLEKETQAALDPEVGAAEAKAMQKEIHRMRLRYAQLMKRQELMITEMERAIYKRDNIEAKGKVVGQRKDSVTQASLQKSIAELSKKLKLTTHDANLTQMNVVKLQEAQRKKGDQLEQTTNEANDLRSQEESVRVAIETQTLQKKHNLQQITKHQRIAKAYQKAAEGVFQPSGSVDDLSRAVTEYESQSQRIVQIVETLSNEFPQLEQQLRTLIATQ